MSEPFGLPTGSLTVMALVEANPGSSQAALATQAGITGPSLVGILDELEKRGLVRRERSPTDRRRNMLVLTDEGKAMSERLFTAVDAIETPIREALGKEDYAQLIAALERAIAACVEGEDGR
ncbi:MarR family transcriptional regulator [Alteraurantiacibacter aquimixticola]|uniref:MarR family transcriptional regulator n=1 Tax=Alteraurantiacibacter aquimixticola TaxID=2489173 RepID=A0A4T3F263_9SPHN|nr:MarR family transcriptional regulator [Alteraurantiacibacter aquimixticola]